MISMNYETAYSGHTFKVEAVSGVDTHDTCTLTRDTLIQVFKCLTASEK